MSDLPPDIVQHFNHNLLSIPMPKLGEDSEDLWKMYLYIVKKLKNKANYDKNRKEKFEHLEKTFMELYERAKTKEKELKEKTGHAMQRPFNFFTRTNRSYRRVLEGLRKKR